MDVAEVAHRREVRAQQKAADRKYDEEQRAEQLRLREFDLDLKNEETSYQKLQHTTRRSQMEAFKSLREERKEREEGYKQHVVETSNQRFEQERAAKEKQREVAKEEVASRRGAVEDSVAALVKRQAKLLQTEERENLRKEHAAKARLCNAMQAATKKKGKKKEGVAGAVEFAGSWLRV
jgi:hypothetical protein